MKKFKKLLVILAILILASVFCISSNVYATEQDVNSITEDSNTSDTSTTTNNQTTDNTTETAGHTYEQNTQDIYSGDLYIAKTEDYDMDQLVDGNVYIFSNKNVKITGQIAGSLFVFTSGTLELAQGSYITNHVFACANKIIYDGNVAYDAYLAGTNVEIGENAITYRDLKIAAQTLSLSGIVGRDVDISANTITTPETEETLTIYGHLNYSAANEAVNLDKANIQGEVNYKAVTEDESQNVGDYILDGIFACIGTVIFDVVLYICLLFFAPKFVCKAKEYVSTRGLLAFAIGLAITILVPIIAVMLLLTGVASGLAILLALVYFVLLMLNAFVVTLAVTGVIANKLKMENKFKKVLLLIPTSIVIWLLRNIPFVGPFVSIIVFLCGVGIIGLYQIDRVFKKEKTEEITE